MGKLRIARVGVVDDDGSRVLQRISSASTTLRYNPSASSLRSLHARWDGAGNCLTGLHECQDGAADGLGEGGPGGHHEGQIGRQIGASLGQVRGKVIFRVYFVVVGSNFGASS